MKLHLGCGGTRMGGFINIDVDSNSAADEVIDLSKGVLPYGDSTCDEMVSYHFIEHITKGEAEVLLKEIFRVMSPGAKGVFELPDTEAIAHNFDVNPEGLIGDMYGWQHETYMGHKYGYTPDTMKQTLERAGFVNITSVPPQDYHAQEGIDVHGFQEQMRVEFEKPKEV
jgi:predicted SAM-dependent methyltransferase